MSIDPTPLEFDGSWLCHHIDAVGNPAATRLRLGDSHDWPFTSYNFRRWINCPDCGTRWRIWEQARMAKPTVESLQSEKQLEVFRYSRAPVLDIDRIIDRVRSACPMVSISQFENAWPSDDDGVWFFTLPNANGSKVQIESSSGVCPFIVEGKQCRTAGSVDDVVKFILLELAISATIS